MCFESCPVTSVWWVVLVFGLLSIRANSDGFRWVVNCPRPDTNDCKISPDNSQYAADDEVNITCNDGYTLKENASLKCHEDGTWSRGPPYCEELRCPKLPGMHGLKRSTYSICGYIQFECDRGLVMVGNETIYCDKNGTWVPNTMPYCRAVTCQKLPQLLNGTIQLKEQAGTQTVAEFECHQGFVLVGSPQLECGVGGSWIPDMMPRCDEEFSFSTEYEQTDLASRRILLVVAVGFAIYSVVTTVCLCKKVLKALTKDSQYKGRMPFTV